MRRGSEEEGRTSGCRWARPFPEAAGLGWGRLSFKLGERGIERPTRRGYGSSQRLGGFPPPLRRTGLCVHSSFGATGTQCRGASAGRAWPLSTTRRAMSGRTSSGSPSSCRSCSTSWLGTTRSCITRWWRPPTSLRQTSVWHPLPHSTSSRRTARPCTSALSGST